MPPRTHLHGDPSVELASDLAIDRRRAALLIIDIQEKLAAAMPEAARGPCERNVCVLIEMARRFDMPVVVSRQYPRGLGPTAASIEAALADMDHVFRLDKVEFSACEADDFAAVRDAVGEAMGGDPAQWIVTGMETHVCVYQTVRQLVAAGDTVHVPRDAVLSRTKANWQVGMELIARAGGILTSTEVVVFDALGRAGTEDFKALSKLIK